MNAARRLGNAHGVNRAVAKTTPVAGTTGQVVVELECKHVLVTFVSHVGPRMRCPDCAAAALEAKKAAKAVKAARSSAPADVRDELIAELRKQVDYLRALNNLSSTRTKPMLVQPPPPPAAVAPAPRVIPPKPPEDVRECPKCHEVGFIGEAFGWRLSGGTWVAQKICTKCRVLLMNAARRKPAAVSA